METERHNNCPEGDDGLAPPKLVTALERMRTKTIFVPPSLDDAVLNAARQHLGIPRTARLPRIRWRFRWPALATACVLLFALTHSLMRSSRDANLAREDVNHDGRVDILDAFQLARLLQTGQTPAITFDLTGDGVVDRRDADAIAARAVRLEKGGRS